jgi:ABC-type oligopeptide transport system substrate-binding subunit
MRITPRQAGWRWTGELAEGMPEISEDGLVWTFTIRQGLTWSDGHPINAHSFVNSMRYLINPLLANRNVSWTWNTVNIVNAQAYFLGENAEEQGFDPVTFEDVGIKALDDYTLQFTLAERTLPIVGMQNIAAFYVVHELLYEAGMNEDRTETTYGTGELLDWPVAGPFYIAEFIPDQFIAFNVRPEHPMASLFAQERIEWRVALDAATREQLFLAGETDSLSIPASSFLQFVDDPRTHRGTGGTVWGVYINSTSEENPILQNRDFRRALLFATDRVAVAEGVFRTFTPAAYFVSTEGMVGDIIAGEATSYRATVAGQRLAPENHGFLPDLANEYFARAFEANGNQRITFTLVYFENSDDFLRTAEVLQENWMNVFGADRFEMILAVSSSAAAYDNLAAGTIDGLIGAMGQSATNPWSSMIVWTSHFPGKIDKMVSPELDELQRRTTVGDLLFASDDERAEALYQIERILMDYVPMVPIFQNSNWQAFSDRTTLVNPHNWAPGRGFVLYSVTPILLDDMN